MSHHRRNLCASIVTAITLSLGTSGLFAQEIFPSHPLRIVVAYTAGTGGDVVARIIAQGLLPILGQNVLVENRPGAGGMVGTEFGAKAPVDGYTLTLATVGTLIITPAMSRNVRYNAEKDFVAVGGVARSAFTVVTANTPEAPQTFQELMSRLKEKGGTFGSPGSGTTTHLVAEIVLRQAGVKFTHVPYRGSTQSLVDVASGQVAFAFDTVGGALSLVKSGRLRPLAVSGADRVASLPGVPTIAESGMPGINLVSWWGLVAPAATPPEIVKKLSDALLRALENPEVKTRFAAQEVEPFPLPGPALGALIRKEAPMWVNLVKETKLTID